VPLFIGDIGVCDVLQLGHTTNSVCFCNVLSVELDEENWNSQQKQHLIVNGINVCTVHGGNRYKLPGPGGPEGGPGPQLCCVCF
jgi:hypothetical protein